LYTALEGSILDERKLACYTPAALAFAGALLAKATSHTLPDSAGCARKKTGV
jgi:hypothetical protein